MGWADELDLGRHKLLPGAQPASVAAVESALGLRFPAEFRDFLLSADGGEIHNFRIYSAGPGTHPEETLLAANAEAPPDALLLAIGRDASHEFGYRRADLPADTAPIYFLLEEWNELDRVAASLGEFIQRISRLEPGGRIRGS